VLFADDLIGAISMMFSLSSQTGEVKGGEDVID